MSKDWEPTWSEAAKCWTVAFSIEGRRIRRRLGIRDKSLRTIARKKAEQLYRQEWEHHLNPVEDPVIKPGQNPFFLAAAAYIQDGGEARFLPRIMEYFGSDTEIAEVDEAAIDKAAHFLYPNAAPDTRRRQVRVPINAVLRHSRGERRRPSTDKARLRWLTPEEAERLLKAAAELTLPRHPLPERETLRKIAFLLGSGCRTGECFAANVTDWNANSRQMWIAGDEVGAGKTALSKRWVTLPRKVVDLMGESPEEGRMFRTPYGKEIVLRQNGGGQMATAFNKARDMAGLESEGPNKVTPHTLRHTWATWFYAQTKDYGELLDQGGWAKSDTAERYRKMAPADLGARLLAHGWDFRQDSGNWQAQPGLRIVSKG